MKAARLKRAQQPENFVLEGAPNSCFDFVLNGNYNPGIALNIDNTVSVMVNVTTVRSLY